MEQASDETTDLQPGSAQSERSAGSASKYNKVALDLDGDEPFTDSDADGTGLKARPPRAGEMIDSAKLAQRGSTEQDSNALSSAEKANRSDVETRSSTVGLKERFSRADNELLNPPADAPFSDWADKTDLQTQLHRDDDDANGSSGVNEEQVNIGASTLFSEEHVRWKDETGEQRRMRMDALVRAPPKSATYYSQDDSDPTVRTKSSASNVTSGRNNRDANPVTDNEGSTNLDQMNMGKLFVGPQSEVANTLADRRGRDTPAGLDLGSGSDQSGSSPPRKDTSPIAISSATFMKELKSVSNPKIQAKVLQDFKIFNDSRNKCLTDLWQLYEQKDQDYKDIMKDYWSGPGDERRRARLEAELSKKELEQGKKKRAIAMALGGGTRAARLAAAVSEWQVDPGTGQLVSPESNNEDMDDESEKAYDGERHGGVGISDEEEEGHSNDEWPGDRRSRLHLNASSDSMSRDLGHQPRDSTYSIDKPLPSVPAEGIEHSLVSIQVLLLLLPVKLALIEQSTVAETVPQTIYDICERASAASDYAMNNNAPLALQGRCAFYMGLAEYLRCLIDEESDQNFVVVTMYFENAWQLCEDVYEEGAWGEEWARWLRSGKADFEDRGRPPVPSPDIVARRGVKEDLVDGLMKSVLQFGKSSWNGFLGRKKSSEETGEKKKQEGDAAADEPKSSSSALDERSRTGKGDKLKRAEDIQTEGDGQEVSSEKQRPVGLSVDTEVSADADNTVLPPGSGMYTTPDKYANGFGRSLTSPTIDKNDDAGVHSPAAGPSPRKQTSPVRGRYHITNPDPPLANTSTDSTERSLPSPVTTPQAVSPGGSTFMSNLTRRLSSAMSPTSDAYSATSPKSIPILEEPGDEATDPDSAGSTERLSIAERRNSSLAAQTSRFLRGGRSPKSQDSLKEMEEGNSPLYQTKFEERDKDGLTAASASGAKESKSGSPKDEAGMRRRRRSGERRGEEMV